MFFFYLFTSILLSFNETLNFNFIWCFFFYHNNNILIGKKLLNKLLQKTTICNVYITYKYFSTILLKKIGKILWCFWSKASNLKIKLSRISSAFQGFSAATIFIITSNLALIFYSALKLYARQKFLAREKVQNLAPITCRVVLTEYKSACSQLFLVLRVNVIQHKLLNKVSTEVTQELTLYFMID